MRRRELVRIATGAVLEILEVDQIGAAITTVNKVVLNSTLIVVQEKIAAEISKVYNPFCISAASKIPLGKNGSAPQQPW